MNSRVSPAPGTPAKAPPAAFQRVQARLREAPKIWVVTGVGGFIGSNLLEALLRLDQRVVGVDNFVTGKRQNLDEVQSRVSAGQWRRFRLVCGDIAEAEVCANACRRAHYVLHQAALASVPRSIADPGASHRANVTGFLNMLVAARDAGVERFVYASSSAVYGDHPKLPKVEEHIGAPLSPYAAMKRVNEIYAAVFARVYGVPVMGLRYFNVFGPRQDPAGAYAAVIPLWIAALLQRKPVYINGDGKTSRDFCYVDNVVQANLLAATTRDPRALNQVYNVAVGQRTTLNELFRVIQATVRRHVPGLPEQHPIYRDFRPGDVRHSLADIRKARRRLGFCPTHGLADGLERALDWYRQNVG